MYKRQHYDSIEGSLLASNKFDDPIVQKFLSCQKGDMYCYEVNLKSLLNVLFTIGLIGIVDKSNNITYATPNRPMLNELDYNGNMRFSIHPLFRKN